MRIVHLITRLIRGGADENTLLTVEGLCAAGEDVTLVVGEGHDTKLLDRVRRAGAQVHIVPLRHFSLISALRCIRPLTQYLREGEFDIAHTHETEMGIVGRLAARRAGIKNIVHTVHGVPFSPHRPFWLNQMVIRLERFCARFTTRMITNSDNIREEYLRKGIGKRKQYVTIRSGIELKPYRHPLRPSTNVRPTITMVGRLAKGKGHTDLLRAVATLRNKVPNLRCWIVGDGEEREAIFERIARFGLNKTVAMLGHREDIPAILSETTVLALPAYWEGTPRAITEAMAAGVPVVATPIGGIPEQVEDGVNGYLVPLKDPATLAQKLEMLLLDSTLARAMGTAGKAKAQTFSKEAMIAGISKLYDSLRKDG